MAVKRAMYRTLCQDDVFWLECPLNENDDWDDEVDVPQARPVTALRTKTKGYLGYYD